MQAGDEPRGAGELCQDLSHLVAAEHHGKASRLAGPQLHTLQVRQRGLEDVATEEEQRGERLVLGRGGDAAVRRQVGVESADLRGPRGRGMLLAVGEDEAADPEDVPVLRAGAILLESCGGPDPVEELRGGHEACPVGSGTARFAWGGESARP
jgi:hypothetical protein